MMILYTEKVDGNKINGFQIKKLRNCNFFWINKIYNFFDFDSLNIYKCSQTSLFMDFDPIFKYFFLY